MSTRATYRFQNEWNDQTFYIHYDGYPEGAAHYFQSMVAYEPKMETHNHGLAEVFFRANPYAEFTKDRDAHGDTEYHYEVGGPQAQYEIHPEGGLRFNATIRQITAYERVYGDDHNSDRWKPFFKGTVDEFIAKYARSEEAVQA